MSVELSHRLARVAHFLPTSDLIRIDRHALWLACERVKSFSDLSDEHQLLILEAEAARERAIAERRAATA